MNFSGAVRATMDLSTLTGEIRKRELLLTSFHTTTLWTFSYGGLCKRGYLIYFWHLDSRALLKRIQERGEIKVGELVGHDFL